MVLAWRIEPSYESATDLISAAVVAARSELAVAPSEWLLSRSFSIPADVKETAQRILTPADLELPERLPEQPLEVGTQDARAVIALNRQLLAAYPRSASRWTDLSLAHSVLGNRDKALRAMQTALSIEPNNRVVLRAAIRPLAVVPRYCGREYSGREPILSKAITTVVARRDSAGRALDRTRECSRNFRRRHRRSQICAKVTSIKLDRSYGQCPSTDRMATAARSVTSASHVRVDSRSDGSEFLAHACCR